jgi:hypothetical protein
MEQFPVLGFIVRFGTYSAIGLALISGAMADVLTWAALGLAALPLAAVVVIVVFRIAKSYVEIVTIITDMLVTQ